MEEQKKEENSVHGNRAERDRANVKKGFFGKLIRSMMIALIMVGLFCVVLVCGMKLLNSRFLLRANSEVMVPAENRNPFQAVSQQKKPLPDVAVQVVFVTDEAGELRGCFYTVLDCIEVRLDFYMVPTDTRLQLSTELYQEMITKNAKLAQINTLESLYRCFTPKEAPECVRKALDEAVGVVADYYTVMPESCYSGMIKEAAHTYAYDEFLQEGLLERIVAAGSMKAYLAELWEQCECSIPAESRFYYLETYEGLTNLRVSCTMVAGERHNNGFVPDGSGLR